MIRNSNITQKKISYIFNYIINYIIHASIIRKFFGKNGEKTEEKLKQRKETPDIFHFNDVISYHIGKLRC